MAILFSSSANVPGADNIFGNITDGFGIPGLPDQDTRKSGLTSDLVAVRDKMNDIVGKLMGDRGESFEESYVESGRKVVLGGNIEKGRVSPLEEANLRQVYSQTPNVSVVIRKRAFSSLGHLYNATLMDRAEKWLLRATKRLIERKCNIMAEYERLVKADRMISAGATTASILASIFTSSLEEQQALANGEVDFNSSVELEKIIRARQPVNVTTYFNDPESPVHPDFGEGSGAFEITAISDLNTNLDLDGNGSCSFSIEDPYKILFVTEEDIETSIVETIDNSLNSGFKNQNVGTLLENAQASDETLSDSRISRGVSQITFSVSMTGSSEVSAVIDAIGFELTTNNLDEVPEEHALTDQEQTLFRAIISGLMAYDQMIRLNQLRGSGGASAEATEQMKYVRDKMRLFYLGKSIIQPMDSINVFIDGGTRAPGEGEDVTEDNNIFTLDGAIKTASSILSRYRNDGELEYQGADEQLLRQEWKKYGQHLTFDDFRKIRTMQLSTETGTHVFGGLVKSVNDKFDANSGKYTLSVQADSNMEWLKISRYNQQPSLDQTQGLVYDPFTPFTFEVDKATGLPTGKPKLLPENEALLSDVTSGGEVCRTYFDTGPKRGKQVHSMDDLEVDIQRLGGNLKRMFYHAPGLKYRWKDGIITAIYDMTSTDPLDGTKTDYKQLRRDVGLFTSNTPFDNMDAANIISVMVTGKPYNYSTFVQSALNSGTFLVDTSLNGQKGYFNSLLDIQSSFIRTHGNFEPYKYMEVSAEELSNSIVLQQRLTGKSSEISQLRTQYADLSDKIGNYKGPQGKEMAELVKKLTNKREQISSKLETAKVAFSSLTDRAASLKQNVIQIAGDDISFDLAGNIADSDKFKLFGDRLFHATLRTREDVIFNRDQNFLIVSDEYDKDYDIQAFVLQLRQQIADMWKSTWQDVYQLCKNVAEILNFEFYCTSQGHLVFRPPQYNRTPASVLAAMLSLNYNAGIKVFPDFLLSLFKTREASVVKDIAALEWKIRMYAALLGKTTLKSVQRFVTTSSGGAALFITSEDDKLKLRDAIQGDKAIDEAERQTIRNIVASANVDIQAESKGLFSSVAQVNVYIRDLTNSEGVSISATHQSRQKAYENAVQNIAVLTGQQAKSFPEYDNIKVGATRNGQSTPSTDVVNLVSKIAGLVSQRSKLLVTLEKLLDQNIEIGSATATIKPGSYYNLTNLLPSDIYNKLIEDDTRNVIGHLSGERFIIRDEHIKSASFDEVPPKFTVAAVHGTEPIVGEGSGKVAGMPLYTAYGVDFDLWRQYGWRGEKPFDKPFFWSADKQCAPYAIMLLSRQRKNVVTGTVTVFGNEFYQLGDVVYVAHRQLLYYVQKVTHSFTYNGKFETTLKLTYGHPPGEYIPTPLDVIGKLSTSRSKTQSAFRMRREKSLTNSVIGVIQFQDEGVVEGLTGDYSSAGIKKMMLSGKYGVKNFNKLKGAAIIAKREVDEESEADSSRIYIITYAGDDDLQNQRREVVARWFENPERPSVSGSNVGLPDLNVQSAKEEDVSSSRIPAALIKHEHIRLCLPKGESFSATENELLVKNGTMASQETLTLDPTLKNVVEIRLRKPPAGGWKKDNNE
jgi:hypothetical protein